MVRLSASILPQIARSSVDGRPNPATLGLFVTYKIGGKCLLVLKIAPLVNEFFPLKLSLVPEDLHWSQRSRI